ncbi:4Fe-4S binding protein [Helicovermis profundi]|uniref:4Fe-4S ferredoxin-type domain-containing protein n=1 Tax=Helicovermis profundi TaxID=3065157 RepID=A0AAU9EX77_9FIRM|nr:hypothetical protein HLPR_20360 [Clostridia bacterium S502]
MLSVKIIKKNLPKLRDYIDLDTVTVKSSKKSPVGLIVPEIVLTYGKGKMKKDDLIVTMPKMVKTIIEVKKSYKTLKNNPLKAKTIIDEKTLNEFKKYAYEIGISDIGFTKVEPSMIFSGKEILFANAFVFTMEMKKESIEKAPSLDSKQEIFRTYLELGKVVNKLSSFLRERGFNAQAGPALGGDVIYPLLAEKAGLGALGKHGLLITPKFGPSLRIAAIYTDIENLPFSEKNEHLWIKSFCEKCGRCVSKCPSNAIYKDAKVINETNKVCIDYKKCAVPFTINYGCSVCIKECSFFRNDYYKIKEKFI